MARVVELRSRDPLLQRLLIGIHVEGPFINPKRGYVGAHPPDAVQPASKSAAAKLVEAGGGLVRLITLAPECDPGLDVTRFLADQNLIVSAGHTDADLSTLHAAVDAGLSMFTHLGNGCPMEIPRHDNIIQRVLSLAGKIRIGLIGDGVHIPLFALKNYVQAAGVENCFVVSDAMSAAGLGPGVYRLGRNEVAVGEDCAARSPDGSHLMGSAVTMRRSAELLRKIGLSQSDVDRLTMHNPAAFCLPCSR
jgi:N-acetylglucosamine-6-phosphate deacetylase